MERPQRMFLEWLDKNWEIGSVGPLLESVSKDLRADSRFLPTTKLHEYFAAEQGRLTKLLRDLFRDEGIPEIIDEETVKKDYLQVLAILIFIGKGEQIEHFVAHNTLADHKLPFDIHAPREFPDASSDERNFYKDFFNAQRHFWTPILSWKKHVEWPSECILPILSKEKLGEGATATAYRIRVHRDYNDLRSQDDPPLAHDDPELHTFVLKYYNVDERTDYDHEVAAFLRVRHGHKGSSIPGLIGFYGSFKQDNRFFIILEHANSGNLDDFLTNNQPPQTIEERTTFWTAFFELLTALMVIHGVRDLANLDKPILQNGWHQDIKPKNIFVCRRRKEGKEHLEFKLGDLGLSHFNPIAQDVDGAGSQIYGAPESYRPCMFDSKFEIVVTPKVDVFSMGAVFSETLTWVIKGDHDTKLGLAAYRRNRYHATRGIQGHATPGCFHDGTAALHTVRNHHEELRAWLSSEDPTFYVITMTDKMLWQDVHRKTCREIFKESQWILPHSRKPNVERQPGTGDPPYSDHSSTHSGSGLHSGLTDSISSTSQTIPSPTGRQPLMQGVQEITSNASRPRTTETEPHSHARGMFSGNPRVDSFGNLRSVTLDDPFVESPHKHQRQDSLTSNGSSTQAIGSPNSNRRLSHSRLCEEPNEMSKTYHQDSEHPGLGLDYPPTDNYWRQQLSHRNGASPNSGARSRMNTTDALSAHLGTSNLMEHDSEAPEPSTPIAKQLTRASTLLETPPPPWSRAEAEEAKGKGRKARDLDPCLQQDLKNRDIILLIDDSASMRKHWDEVEKLVELLTYFLVEFDQNGVELLFTHEDKKVTSKDWNVLVRTVEEFRPRGGQDKTRITNIDYRLGPIVNNYRKAISSSGQRGFVHSALKNLQKKFRPVKPLSVYVFTDGMWQNGFELKTDLVRILETLINTNRHGKQFGVQFIQFGEEEVGTNRLNELDLLRSPQDAKKDVVDHTVADGDFRKILLGAINKWYDDDDETFA